MQQTTNFATSFLIFEKNKVWYFMRIVCQQTILMKYHALFVNFEQSSKVWNCPLLQIIGGALLDNKVNKKKCLFIIAATVSPGSYARSSTRI